MMRVFVKSMNLQLILLINQGFRNRKARQGNLFLVVGMITYPVNIQVVLSGSQGPFNQDIGAVFWVLEMMNIFVL